MMRTHVSRTSTPSKFLAPLVLLALCALAAFVGLALPVLPPRFSLIGIGFFVLVLVGAATLLLPDRKLVPYKTIFVVFSIAVIVRFLWPNFAYLPIPFLPTKNPQRLLWALAIAYWFYSIATNSELRERLARRCQSSTLIVLVFLLFFWKLLSVTLSEYPVIGLQKFVLESFEYLPAVLFVLTWVRDEQDVRRLGRWLALATGVIFLIALSEVIGQRNVFLTLIPIDSTNEEFIQAALESKVRGGGYRVQASFNHPLLLAQFLCVVFPILCLTAWQDRSSIVRGATFVLLLALPAVLWATKTRTGIGASALLAIVAVLLVCVSVVRRPTRAGSGSLMAGMGVLAALAVSVGVIAFALQLAEGRTKEESNSSAGRVAMVERAIDATQQAPLVGLGPGVGGFEAANVTSRGQVSLDSLWLVILLESGIPALLLFLAILASGSWRALQLSSPPGADGSRSKGAWGLSVAGFAVTSAILGTPHNLPLLFIAIGVLVALEDMESDASVAPARLQN